ncbi:class I SAM-dependent methyltransferase [Nonomuraea deserti]|uniref:Class I SAM-dependent methyltransferase n=1 Tax=Nonomuraea deserti TaxID=1848322 RepID=A0A4R4VVC2_9ACTN|nr:class I SAM-dependent methyltransferase [Nonomuraea deserti]
MRVLDLGSGAGNVSRLAAEFVGPEGSVVGVERDPQAVRRAARLAEDAGWRNVEFREGDVEALSSDPGSSKRSRASTRTCGWARRCSPRSTPRACRSRR